MRCTDLPLVRAVNISKKYYSGGEKVSALENINLEIKKGEFVAIMGPSGSGKTTLLNCMSTLDTVSSGKLYIDGRDVEKMNDRERSLFRSRSMGFIFQNYNLIPVLTAAENVELPMLIAGKTPKLARARAIELLEEMGIGEAKNRIPSQLSGGMQQKVAICRAIANEPSILWADEPTGNIDSDKAREIMDMFTDLNKDHGQTVVLVTHDISIANYAKKIIKMRDGSIIS